MKQISALLYRINLARKNAFYRFVVMLFSINCIACDFNHEQQGYNSSAAEENQKKGNNPDTHETGIIGLTKENTESAKNTMGSMKSNTNTPQVEVVLESISPQELLEIKAAKDKVVGSAREIITDFKKTVHEKTGLSRYDIYVALLHGNTSKKSEEIFTKYKEATRSDQNLLLPDWFDNPNRVVGDKLDFIERKLFGKRETPRLGEFVSLIAVGPYKPIGYAQEAIFSEWLQKQYSSKEYIVFDYKKNLFIGHLPSIDALLNLNNRKEILDRWNIKNSAELVHYLAENHVKDQVDFIHALFGDVKQSDVNGVVLTKELIKLQKAAENLSPEKKKNWNFMRFLSYQLQHGLPAYTEDIVGFQ